MRAIVLNDRVCVLTVDTVAEVLVSDIVHGVGAGVDLDRVDGERGRGGSMVSWGSVSRSGQGGGVGVGGRERSP